MKQSSTNIIPIKLPFANAYLVRGQRWVLVDTGMPGDEARILRVAAQVGIQPQDIGLIFLTHGHVDHFGSAEALRRMTGAPIAVHAADRAYLESGRNPEMQALSLETRLLRPFIRWSVPGLTPDLTFTDDFDFAAYGLEATLIATPGHSPGSVALLLPDGGLVAGDILRGGYLNGLIARQQPKPPYYVADLPQLWASLERVLELSFTTMYVGHGGPLAAGAIRECYGRWKK